MKWLLPNWNLKFAKRLEKYDFVAFSASTQNCPWDLFSMFKQTKNYLGHEWNNNVSNPPIIGSSITIESKKYARYASSPIYIAGDGTLVEKYKYSISSITGYHIGFNQEMDGFKKIGDYSRFPIPEHVQMVLNMNTNESKKLDISKIREVFEV
jgi:hypothetical protein